MEKKIEEKNVSSNLLAPEMLEKIKQNKDEIRKKHEEKCKKYIQTHKNAGK